MRFALNINAFITAAARSECFCSSFAADFLENDMNLRDAQEGKEYIISRIETDDEELDAFLFSLGCYSGEPITVISHKKGGCVVSIKDGRYSIDSALAEAIII